MKRSTLFAYLILLFVSFVLAYVVWTREPGRASAGEVSVFPCRGETPREVEFKAGDRTVRCVQKKSAYSGKSFWWIDAAGEGFKASGKFAEALGRFCPWKALRDLGDLGDEKKQEFGLAGSQDRLVLGFRAGQESFRIGTAAQGSQDRYVEDERSGRVYLVRGQDLRDLEHPKSRFMERNLHSFDKDHVARVRLQSGERGAELVPVHEAGKVKGWADAGSPTEPKDPLRNWMQKYFTLRFTDYVKPEEEAESMACSAPVGTEEVFSLTFYDEKKEIGFFRLYRKPGAGEKEQEKALACADNTDCVVEIPWIQAESLIQELNTVLSGAP